MLAVYTIVSSRPVRMELDPHLAFGAAAIVVIVTFLVVEADGTPICRFR